MAKIVETSNWTKPELKRLGTLKDVSGNSSPLADGVSVNPRAS